MDGLRATSKKVPKKIIRNDNIKKVKKEPMLKKSSALTNLVSIVVTAVIVGGAIYAWQDKAKVDSLNKIQQDAKNTREGYERSLKNIENNARKVEGEIEVLKTENDELKNTAELVKGAIKKYNNDELGMSFYYPAILGDLSYEKMGGEVGEKFIAKFSNNPNFFIAGVSSDYGETSTSTETNFENFIKIKKEKDKYLYIVSDKNETLEYSLKPVEVIPFSGGEALLLDKNSFVSEDGKINVGIGQNVGAVLNTKKEGFSGVAMLDSDFGKLSLEEFKTLLKSIELK